MDPSLMLNLAVAAVCPIDGVAIGDPADKETWRIDFASTANDEQKAAGQAALEAFDLAAAVAVYQLKAQAQFALDASDVTFIRCGKAAVAWPSEWQAYVMALRAIIKTGTGAMPVRPAYPANT